MDPSDPTQIKRGDEERLAVALTDPPAAELALYERSPTLMAGEVAGTQGGVRVWAPNRKLLWLTIMSSGLLSLLCVLSIFTSHNFWLVYFLIPVGGFSVSMAALRRPRLVVTDDAGIAVTTKTGSRALRWQEVNSALRTLGSDNHAPKIVLMAPDPVEIALSGFPKTTRRELMETIVARAGLIPFSEHKTLYVNPVAPLPEARTLMGEADRDIRREIAAGKMIQAIKLYRQRYGTGLKESKDVIDSVALNMAMFDPEAIYPSSLPSPEARATLMELICAGDTAKAKEFYRENTNATSQQADGVIRFLQTRAALMPAEQEPSPRVR